MIRLALALSAVLLCCGEAVAQQSHTGNPEMDKWFHDQLIPGKNQRCCDTSDGAFVEEDIRNGHYWVRWEKTKGEWLEVPDAVVINNPNKWGMPAVWWGWEEEGQYIYIKCYVPGAKS